MTQVSKIKASQAVAIGVPAWALRILHFVLAERWTNICCTSSSLNTWHFYFGDAGMFTLMPSYGLHKQMDHASMASTPWDITTIFHFHWNITTKCYSCSVQHPVQRAGLLASGICLCRSYKSEPRKCGLNFSVIFLWKFSFSPPTYGGAFLQWC